MEKLLVTGSCKPNESHYYFTQAATIPRGRAKNIHPFLSNYRKYNPTNSANIQ